ncbi:cytochrome c3 family protein [Geomonas nitrogeniifigens]|uniref:Cytochrome c3 family protein n=1 Tax=Geomonas diazotrophica TaxID=2843197 RepID=A0ABX8JES3_9BACT|nr:cytochrome c3 family protein [Geomonas nitrogeniifigens]QWV96486.1 cytochrome c3 family protein [Geomonas nitrogeniifigens]QXE85592.1 cytochrome c3 family protein [Geomonas nitrogeniifigens]
MRTEQNINRTLQRMVGLAYAAATVLCLVQEAGAFGSNVSRNGERCAYTQQLQTSVQARRDYLVKIDAVRGLSYTSGSSVEDMYGNIVAAGYSDDSSTGSTGILSILSDSKYAPSSLQHLDAFSVNCLSCHDGVLASQINVDVRDRPSFRRSMGTLTNRDHPLGMTYEAYVAAARGYKDVGSNTKMIFVNGRVGCLTCHDPLNPDKGHLVMSDYGSALCKSCHDK